MRKAATWTPTSTAAMDHWMSLSRSAPLDFLLETKIEAGMNDRDTCEEVSSAHAAAVLRVLANEAHRWRSASLLINHHVTEVLVDILLNQFNHASLPNLKRLQIFAYPGNNASGPVDNLARAIGSINSLTELYLTMAHSYVPSLLADIPWGQLTTVYFSMMLTPSQVASFLAQSTAIVTATFALIDTTEAEDGLDWDVQHCMLPKLKNLTMNGSSSMLGLFDLFDFVCLEHLDFSSTFSACYQLVQWLMEHPNLPVHRLALHVIDQLLESDFANCLHIQRLRQVLHVEFYSRDILKIAAGVVAQQRDDIPALWSWRPEQGGTCVGWKTDFDHTDKQVTRIVLAP